ncbi:MAG: YoaK family protein [Luteolibacter sp.]
MRPFSPSQIVFGGCLLAFGASFLNTGFILNTGTSVSHLTGDIARIGSGLSSLGSSDGVHIKNVTIATLGFITGATISGFLLHHPTLEISKPYGRILSALGAALVAAHFAYAGFPMLAIAIASAVCGAQNALASRYRGVVLRTTHLTGLFTDFGIHLGMKLRGHHVEGWKLLIPVLITFSFLIGAISSSILMLQNAGDWILFTGIGFFLGGILWSVYKRVMGARYDAGETD